ncbi:4Fe-4S dicluster domain-containing protein [Tepidiforma sp.]|uniref:4Fe-4S dicluster domain-containing protein n=1 Tax=Tepidiforma sp. TaxID=2682230 RepID=UPI002ADE053E|nr:4Fe-4S dicluster domain-containing protein [Tepidiforma sp.]
MQQQASAGAAAPEPVHELPEVSRRDIVQRLLKLGAVSLAAALGSGASLQPLLARAEEVNPRGKKKRRYGMVIDTRRCVGCDACVAACKAENKTPPGVSYTIVLEQGLGERPDDRPLFMTKPCFHCEHPPCVPVCPVGATFKRSQDGIVVVDYDRCIGCRYCIVACPYQARYSDFGDNYPAVEEHTPWASVPSPEYRQFRTRKEGKSPEGNVRKCTFCLHLQDENGEYDRASGRWPACAKTCTGKAIHFGDLNDPTSEVSLLLKERQAIRLKEELGTEPNVYYLL